MSEFIIPTSGDKPSSARIYRIHPRTNSQGWLKSCAECGRHFLWPYRAAGIRDGRENLCVDCYLEGLRND